MGDPALAQVGTDLAGGITLVGDQPVGADPGPAAPGAGDADGFDDLDQAGAVVDVAARDDEGQRSAPSVTGEMHLGGQPAAGSSERSGMSGSSRRRPLFTGTGGVLMGAHDGGVHTHRPVHRPTASSWTCRWARIAPRCHRRPTAGTAHRGLPVPVPLGQVPPGGAGGQLPQHPVQHGAVIQPSPAPEWLSRQQRLDPLPGRIG